MEIRRILFENLNSLQGKNEISLKDGAIGEVGLFAITGDTGAGKSTILDAITLALYGKMHRNKQVEDVMSYGTVKSLAEVEFSANGELYLTQWTIWRARDKADGKMQGPSRSLSRWNEATKQFDILAKKIREIDSQIEEITGLDYDRFSRSVLLSQGDFDKFLKADEKERSNLLEKLTGTEIYTEISKEAFEKNKIEQEKLAQIDLQIQSLELLSADAVADIKVAQKGIAQELQTLEVNTVNTQQQLQLLEQLQLQKMERSKVQIAIEDWDKEQAVLQVDLDRLVIHNKTRHLHPTIHHSKKLLEQTSVLYDEIESLDKKVFVAKEKATTAARNSEKASVALVTKRGTQESLFQTLDTVTELDVNLATLKTSIRNMRDEYKELERKKSAIDTTCNNLKQRIDSQSQSQNKLKSYLSDNAVDADLEVDLASIQAPLVTLEKVQQLNIALDKENQNLAQQHRAEQSRLEEVEAKSKEVHQKLETLQERFEEYFPAKKLSDAHGMVLTLQQSIQEGQALETKLTQCEDLQSNVQKLEAELKSLQTEWSNSNTEQQGLKADIQVQEQEIAKAQSVAELRQTTYEIEKARKDYETERANLEEGTPCPLCLSEEHPFRKLKNYTPKPDLAKKEWEAAEQNLKSLEKDLQALAIQLGRQEERQQSLGGKLEQGTLVFPMQTTLLETQAKLRETISSLPSGFDMTNIEKHLVQQSKEVERLKDQHEKLPVFIDRFNRFQKNQQDLQTEFQTLSVKVKAMKENYDRVVKEYEAGLAEENRIEKELQPYFDKYEVFADHFQKDIFENRKNKYLATQQEADDLETTLTKLRHDLEKAEQDLTYQNEQIQKLVEKGKTERMAKENLETKRRDLLPLEEKPSDVRKVFEQELNRLDTALDVAKKAFEQATLEQERLMVALQGKQQLRTGLLEELTKDEAKLRLYVEQEGLESVEVLQQSMLSSEELERLEQLQKERVAQITRLKTKQETLSVKIETLETETEDFESMTVLHEQLTTMTARSTSLKEQLGAFKERLLQNEERVKNSLSLMEARTRQRKEAQRWHQLNDLIGQADGKKFRVFAQGITLKRLTDLANHHLESLNDRYRIHKPNDRDLELEIVDTYQADHARSVNTLSGGESFLVSLALALGLSDLAGRHTKIRSLFIDEGFGTLDMDTLEMALQTLERLQNKGKTIGVISHIPQLKERISVQVQVEKKGNGQSVIQVVG